MLAIFTKILGLFEFASGALGWLRDRELRSQGERSERLEANEKVIENVEKAKRAATVTDDARAKRLRNRFDRSANGK